MGTNILQEEERKSLVQPYTHSSSFQIPWEVKPKYLHNHTLLSFDVLGGLNFSKNTKEDVVHC